MIEGETLVNVAGSENVDRQQSTLEAYSRDMSLVKPVRPACIVRVKNLDTVQKLVKLAGETQTPLVPSVPVLPISGATPFPPVVELSSLT